ncbi:unnamed protein product [Penicillium roqueforti FM164]|uniref:Genomic scaffold, ProqFM164S01 n=1 Tax=Penicillium roqueforti (strain FM164) TaxID=1365484 RepID=W6PWS0_PENRF|nr:unnamed protein product [Penicillium roqueforti FM164]
MTPEGSLSNHCNTTSLVHHMTFAGRISEIHGGCPPHSTTQSTRPAQYFLRLSTCEVQTGHSYFETAAKVMPMA